ncbi:MAG TPA: valine--tRNA ligase [Methanofastidiosum sp.]|nr:valine--tRNA ligase [Methanofastidiosum sp.]
MLDKDYDGKKIEKKWQNFWLENQIFKFNPDKEGEVYVLDTPPPFTSGSLHMGHVMDFTWIDFTQRYKRMRGFNVYCPQGFDCHGLPTELKVEHEFKISKDDKEAFIEKCKEWTAQCVDRMKRQMTDIGYFPDWSRMYLTMKPEYLKLIQTTLINFYHKGYLFREKHPVLWCPKCQTALAKAEVGYEEKDGKLYYLKLPIEGESEHVEIATTRPELMPSCVGVFFNPKDPRYEKFKGKSVILPIFDRKVPILSDEEVDMSFGTGIVYCCTYGDEQDILWQKKYDLDVITSITEDGKLKAGKKYDGLPVKEARKGIVSELDELGLLVKVENMKHRVLLHVERGSCKSPIELLPMEQYFINVRDFKDDLINNGKKISWHPGYMYDRFYDWTDSMDWDWIISRQRVFGTPIPFWKCKDCGELMPAKEEWLPVDPRFDKPKDKCKCGSDNFIGEVDVCDCWVDSSATPLAISRYLRDDKFFSKTYPSTIRPQGYEIIRTWLFYTLFRCNLITGVNPWKETLIHGMVAGPDGRKMSKSLGNVIEPDEPLKKYCADALRQWALLASKGEDFPFSWKEIEHGNRFLTKFWNVSRFIEMNISEIDTTKVDMDSLTVADRWILSKLSDLVKLSRKELDDYNFAPVLKEIRNFLWHEVADNYIEIVKYRLYTDIKKEQAAYTLKTLLRNIIGLISPYTPHITEEIYNEIFSDEGIKSIHLTTYPDFNFYDKDDFVKGELLKDITVDIRRYKSDLKMPLNAPINAAILYTEKNVDGIKEDISKSMNISTLEIKNGKPNIEEKITAVVPRYDIIGPKFGKDVQKVKSLLTQHITEIEEKGQITLEGFELNFDYIERVEREFFKNGKKVNVIKDRDFIVEIL